jgi:hypothetical protein
MRLWQRVLPLMLVVMMGCGDGRVKLPTAPVTGTVTYQGKPLRTGRIVFFHSSGHATGTAIGADGTFTLSAYQGKNQVAIECFAAGSANAGSDSRAGMSSAKSLVPDRYANYSTSGLTLEVKPNEPNRADFVLKD